MIAMPVVQARIVEAADDRLTLGHAKAAAGDRHRQRIGARAHLLAAGAVARHGDQRRCADLVAQLAAAAAAGPGMVPVLHDVLSSSRLVERRVGKWCVSTVRYRWSQYHDITTIKFHLILSS